MINYLVSVIVVENTKRKKKICIIYIYVSLNKLLYHSNEPQTKTIVMCCSNLWTSTPPRDRFIKARGARCNALYLTLEGEKRLESYKNQSLLLYA